MKRRNLIRAAAGLTAGLAAGLVGAPALAAEFPDRPIKLVLPFPPGGNVDTLGRMLADFMSRDLGQPVVVDNRPGANTQIGLDHVLNQPADGYTLFLAGAPTFIMNPVFMKNVRYDPWRDVEMISVTSDVVMVMVVPANSAAKSVADFVRIARENPNKVTFGSVGNGGTMHLAGELFSDMAGVNLVHVPYKGSAPALTDLMAGRIDLIFDPPSSSIPQVQAGKLRALGLSSRAAPPHLQNIPAVADTVSGFDMTIWLGIAARSNLPKPVKARLKASIDRALTDPVLSKRLAESGNTPRRPMTETEISDFIRNEDRRWRELIAKRKIEVN